MKKRKSKSKRFYKEKSENYKAIIIALSLLFTLSFLGNMYQNIEREDLIKKDKIIEFRLNKFMETTKHLNCCYPKECSQSQNNLENCNCVYPIYCSEDGGGIYGR